jgi:hypothetical protein
MAMGKAPTKEEPVSDKIMKPAGMKVLLSRSKTEPVQAAIGVTVEGDGIILLDKKMKPKKVLAQLKKEAAAANIKLQPSTLRFGKAEVDTDYDPGMVRFFINKEAPGNMRVKLLEVVKRVPYQKVELNVDASFEDEPDEEAYQRKWAQLEPRMLEELQAKRGDASKMRAVSGFASEKAEGGDFESAMKALDALEKLIAEAALTKPVPTPPPPPQPKQQVAPDKAEDAYQRKWAQLEPRMLTQLQAQRGDVSKIRAVSGFASEKAAGGDYEAALKGLDALEKLLEVGVPPAPPPPPQPKQQVTPDKAGVYDKSGAAWLAARKKMESDIDTLRQSIVTTFKGDPNVAKLESSYRARVAPVLAKLDESFAQKLVEVAKAGDASKRADLVKQAKQILDGYQQYLTGEGGSLIKDLDENPFVPLSIRAVMGGTITTLSKAVS